MDWRQQLPPCTTMHSFAGHSRWSRSPPIGHLAVPSVDDAVDVRFCWWSPTHWRCSNRSVASVGPTPYRGVGLVLVVLRESSPLTLPIYFYAKIVILRYVSPEDKFSWTCRFPWLKFVCTSKPDCYQGNFGRAWYVFDHNSMTWNTLQWLLIPVML